MERNVLQFLQDNQLHMSDKKVIVAISGGPDSVALLHMFKNWRERYNLQLHAMTINHQLRKESKEDVDHVAKLCHKWNIPLTIEHIDVHNYEEKYRVSTQVAARNLRYKAFDKIMKKEKAQYLAMGHHGDDQIETMVMALMRTTNLASLTSIPFQRPFSNGKIIRPLLTVSKAEIEQYCHVHNLPYRIDMSNKDITYTRNYVRELIVPKLKVHNERLHVTIQQLAESLQEDETYLQTEAQNVFQQIAKLAKEKKKVTFDIAKLQQYPTTLQRRVYRLTLDYLYKTLPERLSYTHEQVFLSLLNQDTNNKTLHFPQQLMIEKVYDQIEFYFKETEEDSLFIQIHTIPTTVLLPDGNELEIMYINKPLNEPSKYEFYYPVSRIALPLQIRTRKPGDRMRYEGLNGRKKLKDIFIDEKIPRKQRDKIIVIADNDNQILWLVTIRKAAFSKKTTQENEYILFRYIKN